MASRLNELAIKRSWREEWREFVADRAGIPKGTREGESGFGKKRNGN